MEAVAGCGKACLGGFAGLKLVPEGPEGGGLVRGQKPEDAVGRAAFPLVLIGHILGVVGEGVPGVYLDEVMD